MGWQPVEKKTLGRKDLREGDVEREPVRAVHFGNGCIVPLPVIRVRTYCRTRDHAKAGVFDYIERFYNPKRRHSTIGYMSPMEFGRQAGLA